MNDDGDKKTVLTMILNTSVIRSYKHAIILNHSNRGSIVYLWMEDKASCRIREEYRIVSNRLNQED